jgi:excisionase family DNA binding protein
MQINIDTKDLKTIDEAAAIFQKHRNTIYNWLEDKRICGVRIGGRTLIPQTEIDRILKADTPLTQAMIKDEV